MYAALSLDLPAAPDPDQRDRNDLLIVLDMFRGRERLVELGHIGVGVIADVAKPVVPDLLRLADEVVFIVLAEQAVGARMLLRSIYNALDLNSHFMLFQLVSRRGFGLAGDLDARADRPQAVHRDKLPLCILPNPAHRGDCVGVGVFVARKVFVKFFYVLIPKDRMLCVGRVSERILYRIMRSGCRNADNIYNNAGHVVFRGLVRLVDGRGVRLPNGVESGGRGGCCNPITRLDGGRCCVRFPIPAEEVVAFSGRNRAGNGERHRAGAALLRHRVGAWHVGDEIRRVGVVGQGVGDGGGNSLLRNQVNRIRCLRSSRTGDVEVINCGVLFGLFRPANEFIARIQLAFQRRNADISELADQNRMIEARMACAILACIGLINRHAIAIASVELIADIKNLVLDCLCFIRFQRLRTDTVVSRKGRHRQHAEHHNQN